MAIRHRSNKLVWPLSIVLAVVFIAAGAAKLAQWSFLVDRFAAWGYPEPLLMLVGTLEIVGAVLLLVPRIASVGAIALGGIMLGAIYTHVFRGVAYLAIVPIVTLVAIAFVGNRRLDSPFANQTNRTVPLPPSRHAEES